MDFSNPVSSLNEKFFIPIVSGIAFDEIVGKVMIIIVNKRSYNYAVEVRFN
jgi:hypothetical protein